VEFKTDASSSTIETRGSFALTLVRKLSH
jgi:hypothetical protein